MTQPYDIIIIGGGPGGYVAAIRAAQLGQKVALIEATHLGGICLNWGCIPTKALLRASEFYHSMLHAAEFGFQASSIKVDFKKVIQRSRDVASQLTQGIRGLLKKNKVEVYMARASLAGKAGQFHTIALSDGEKAGTSLQSKTIILATGARPRILPNLEPDGKDIWTSKEAMVPDTLPKSLLVVGSGAIGCEYASFYQFLGTDVTLVEVKDRILPVEDEEISAFVQKAFEKRKMQVHTGTIVEKLEKTKSGIKAHYKAGTKRPATDTFEKVIVAVGVVGNTASLGLEKTKVKVENGQIQTDAVCQTAEAGIYAIGDVAGAPWLAHKASHEGVIAVEHIAGKHPHALQKKRIPGCTYSTPQVASIGMTEAQAKAAGHSIKVGRFPYIGNGKAIALGEPEGLVKTIFDAQTGQLLGAHMVGAEVTEMIQGYAIAMQLETTEEDLMQTIFPHPTLSEMMHESVLNAYGRTIHF